MPVENFVDNPEPANLKSPIWRFIELWKLKDLIQTGELYFRRADMLDDEHEGLPPLEYERVLNLNKYDLQDIQERDHEIGWVAQIRQSFYINCWHLDVGETAKMWRQYGKDGVALVSRYDKIKEALNSIPDQVMVGLVRYGFKHLTGWNVIRFINTKREEYASEREVRAMIWIKDIADSMTRHIDENNRPHDRPIYDPPLSMTDGIRRKIDISELIDEIILSPWAPESHKAEIKNMLTAANISINVRDSSLKPYSSYIPTEDELKRFM